MLRERIYDSSRALGMSWDTLSQQINSRTTAGWTLATFRDNKLNCCRRARKNKYFELQLI